MDLRIFIEPQQGASYDDQLVVAREAERLGFDAFFRSDHYLVMGDGDGLPGPTDSWVTLAGIARETSTIRLGTLVTSATFRHPGVLAISVAQVDAMSHGRVELGLGAGWFDAEHTSYALPFPPLGERFERLEEQLTLITGMWATPEGERYDFDGRHYTVVDSPALPKPVQRPGPPVIVGGGGLVRTPRLAAAHAAEFNMPFSSVHDTAEQFARVRAACEAVDRDPTSLVLSAAQVVCCATDVSDLARRAASIGRDVDELRTNGLCGTPEEIIEKLAAYAAVGCSRIYLQLLDLADLDHLAVLGTDVLAASASL
jgi:alkanesulfonate monooxygenase